MICALLRCRRNARTELSIMAVLQLPFASDFLLVHQAENMFRVRNWLVFELEHPQRVSNYVTVKSDLQDADVRKRKNDIVIQLALALRQTLPQIHVESIFKQSIQHIRVDPDPSKLYAEDPPVKTCRAARFNKLARAPFQRVTHQKHKHRGR